MRSEAERVTCLLQLCLQKQSSMEVDSDESELPQSVSSSGDATPVPPKPLKREKFNNVGRGRGRGRPRKGRGRGAGRGRGRGRGKYAKGAESRPTAESIQRSFDDRRERIQNLVDNMAEADVRELLRKQVSRDPGLFFDILSAQAPQPPGTSPQDNGNPDWCTCGKCKEMPTDPERLCCLNTPENCITLLPDFNVLILDEAVLALCRWQRMDMLAINDEDTLAKANRHQAYRNFVLWQHGRLGEGNRVVVPSCCVWRIRNNFPDPFGQYRGYLPSRIG